MTWKYKISTITLLTMVLAGVGADFVFTIQLPLFQFTSGSPQRTVRDGQCCVCCEAPVLGTCPASCNATLLVCIREADHPLADNSCPLGEIVAAADPSTMELSGTFQGPWEGVAQVSIAIFHYNETVLETADVSTIAAQLLLDLIFINQISLPPSAPPTLVTGFTGGFGAVSLTATFQVVCALNFFGTDCNTMCENRNDSLGHFTCDPVTGERVCLEGYRDVEENCTTCVPSPSCSPIGGMCIEPGECMCLLGFSGDNCLESISGLPSLPGFSSASQTAPLPTSELVNLISSTAELQLVPTQTTRMQQTVAISLPLTSVLQLLPSPVSMATSTPPTSRTVEVQTTPIVVPNRDREKGMTIYIIIGAVVVAVLFVLTALVIFALIMVANRRHLKKKALKEQERSESRYMNVAPNFETSSRYTSSTTLDKLDPYMDVIPGNDPNQDGNTTLTHPPTYSTFQQSDSGILSQGTLDDERTYATPDVITNSAARTRSHSEQIGQVYDDLGYAKPIVVTNSTPERKPVLHQDHEYAVLECKDSAKKEGSVCKDSESKDLMAKGRDSTVDGESLDHVTKEDAVCKGNILSGDLMTEEGSVFQDGSALDGSTLEEDLLDSIERTMAQITQDLQVVDQETNLVSAESDFSFICSTPSPA